MTNTELEIEHSKVKLMSTTEFHNWMLNTANTLYEQYRIYKGYYDEGYDDGYEAAREEFE
jgi:hypothetical protein